MFECLPRIFDIRLAEKIAIKKEPFLSNKSQNSMNRSKETKVRSAFKGIFSEMMVVNFLLSEVDLSNNKVKWYDIERETFKYIPGKEYDIKLKPNTIIDVRSSYFYESTDIIEAFGSNKMDYIPSYTNKNKSNERMTDISIRVLYNYVSEEIRKDRYYNRSTANLASDLLNGKAKSYIIGFITKDMIADNYREKSLNQNNAKYKAVPLRDGISPDKLKNLLTGKQV